MATVDIKGYCTLCRSRCGTINTVRDGQFVSVRPDTSHPTGSAMCMKGRAAPELVYSPHRIRHPMRRSQPKGASDPGWVRISWDEALAEVAEKLDAIRRETGPEGVVFAVTTPSGTPLSDSIDWIERFVRHYGSPNICYATEICNWHKDFAHAFTFGCGMPTPDVEHADLVMLWGHNPTSTWLAQADAGGRGRAMGAKLLVVDPRPTALAQQADCWLGVRPGTDAALALGLAHLLISNKTYDEDFVRRWTNATVLIREDNGEFLRERDLDETAETNRFLVWDEDSNGPSPDASGTLTRSVLVTTSHGDVRCQTAFELLSREVSQYTPQHVSDLTGVSVDTIHDAATLIVLSKRIAYHAWSGVGQHTNATQTERAIAVLYALTGAFDKVGGNRIFAKHKVRPISEFDQLPESQRNKALGLKDRPIGPPSQGWVTARDTYEAILTGHPYQVRAMVGFGSNALSSHADIELAERALRALEFHVHCDLFVTPTAAYADVVLPVGTPWEREGLRVGFDLNAKSQERIQFRPRIAPVQGESRSDNDIVFDLALRLGMKDAFFGGNLEAGWNHMLSPTGLTVAQLRAMPGGIDLPCPQRIDHYQTVGFSTETRRVELYSARLHRHGQPGLPMFVPPAEGRRPGSDRYPLILSSAKNGYFCHSQHRSLPSLRKRALRPMLEIGAKAAAARDICDGDPVVVTTRLGQAHFVAKLVPTLQADTVVAEFGWWQACPEIGAQGYPLSGKGNSHYNGLISSEALDPVSGSFGLRSFRCQVARDADFDIAQRYWQGWRKFRLVCIETLCDGALGFDFAPVDHGLLPDFLPGQHVLIKVDTAEGRDIVRAYSLTGSATESGRKHYSIAVRHQRSDSWAGIMSSHLHTRAKVGMECELRAPSGRFTLPVDIPRPVILIAGGIGITPFISQLRTLMDRAGNTPEITLHYANKGSQTHAFRAHLEALSQALPTLRLINHYQESPPGDSSEVSARITDHVITDEQIAARACVYMCGPGPMMDVVREGLIRRGMPHFDIFSEQFVSPPAPVVNDASYNVIFRNSRIHGTWQSSSGTLLQFAEKLGVNLPNGCRVGQCESCAVKLLKGTVIHSNGAIPEEADIAYACQALPASDIEVDA